MYFFRVLWPKMMHWSQKLFDQLNKGD